MSFQDSESRRFEQTFLIWLSFSQADLGPKSAQEMYFSGFFEQFETFFLKICAHSERYRNLLAGIFEILTFFSET